MSCHQRNDAMLMEILQEHKSIVSFLEAVFGFLRRNTDFYYTKTHSSEKIGFERGLREKLISDCMQRYEPEGLQPTMTDYSDIVGDCAPPAVMEVTVGESSEETITPDAETKMPFLSSDYKNGSVFDQYCWSQSLNEIELHVLLPPTLWNPKHVKVEINAKSISVGSKMAPTMDLLTGEIFGYIKHNDAIWTLQKGLLHISCDKTKEQWWDRFFITEEPVDIKKLDCERYVDELSEETQAKIHNLRLQQMMADQQTQS